MKPIGHYWQQFVRFMNQDLWSIELGSLTFVRQLGIRAVRAVHLVVRGYREDELSLHASALTFTTLMSLVPFLAFIFVIAKGVGGQELFLAKYAELIAEMPAQFREFADKLVEIVLGANYFALGGIAITIWVVAVIKVLGSIESSFNRVWGVSGGRPFYRKLTDYLSTLIVVTLFLLFAATFSADAVTSKLGIIGEFSKPLLVKMTPWISSTIALAFLYTFMPNTKVRLAPALLSGMITAAIFLTWQRIFVKVQVGVFTKDAIFGTFAAIPIFLAWVYVCWVIILIGVEIAFSLQNTTTFENEMVAARASAQSRLKLALAVVAHAAQSLLEGSPAFDKHRFAEERTVSIRLLNRVLEILCRAGMVAEVSEEPGRFVLLKDPARIPVKEILDVVMQDGVQPGVLGLSSLDPALEEALQAMSERTDKALADRTVADLVIKGVADASTGGAPA